MPQPASTKRQFQTENRCPDCLSLQLKATDLKSKWGLGRSPDTCELFLDILLNEQTVDLPIGKVQFGIQRGELRLELTHCTMPLDARALGTPLDLSIAIKRQQKKGSEQNSGLKASNNDQKLGIEATAAQKNTQENHDEFQWTAAQVTQKGAPETPAWVFEVKTGEPVLKGQLTNVKLGELQVAAPQWTLVAKFSVELRDVYLSQLSGIWLVDLLPAKRAVLDRALALLILRNKLRPYLSKVEFY